jgi:hypothetical protein
MGIGMSGDPTFEAFLISKKIDSAAFKMAEPEVWMAWKVEFEQTHANSFTMQKLNLINPIRRKYQLQVSSIDKDPAPNTGTPAAPPAKPLKPRPKMN